MLSVTRSGVIGKDELQDLQFFVLHKKAEYGANKSFLELVLKELILGSCFKVVGREFHWCGPTYLRDR